MDGDDDWEGWLWKKQAGRCAICFREDQRLILDHDHVTGFVRGLLCRGCNILEGMSDIPRIRYYRLFHPALGKKWAYDWPAPPRSTSDELYEAVMRMNKE